MEKAGILHSKHDRLLLFKRKSEVIFVYIFIAAMLLSDRFMTERNLRNLIISNIGLLFVAYGQLFIVLLGGVDLSVGSVISLTNVICVTMITENPSTWFLAFIASGSGRRRGSSEWTVGGERTAAADYCYLGDADLFCRGGALYHAGPGGNSPL